MSFAEALEDPYRGLVADLHDSPTVVIAFGGIHTRMGGIPPYEFFGQLDGLDIDRVFVRDLDQAWYQNGIRGIADNITDAAKGLAELRDHERVVCVGCSAGGFAAILFGQLIDADETHAFGPQTVIAKRALRRMGDRRWDRYLKPVWKHVGTLLDVGLELDNVTVHYGTDDRLDVVHAERLAGLAKLVPYEGLGHELTRTLRDRGELQTILREAVR